MEKLTQEHLDELRTAHSKYQGLRSEMADISIHEIMIQQRKMSLMEDLNVAKGQLIELEEKIKKDYSAKSIHLGTGEVEK